MWVAWFIGALLMLNLLVVVRKIHEKAGDYRKYTVGERVTFPLIVWIAYIVLFFLPIVNIIVPIIGLIAVLVVLCDEYSDYVYVKPGWTVKLWKKLINTSF